MKQSEILRAEALNLYAEARAIHQSGWDAFTMGLYLDKLAEAHKVDMAYNDARDAEWRAEQAK
jgi:hypothetical protein